MTERSQVPWLSDDEQRLWRAWVDVTGRLAAALQRDMQANSGLSMSDFEVLVILTDAPEGRVRVTELAKLLAWERSRISHHVSRMEKRGLVSRAGCPDDKRGAFVEVTDVGRDAIERAAPDHVRTVRRLLIDRLEPGELAAMTAVLERVRAGLE